MMNREVSKFLAGVWTSAWLFCWLFAGCHSVPAASGGDSETHFLAECTDTCSGGLTCLCGVCSKPCSEQASCSALSPAATCTSSCGDANGPMCDITCTLDADCSSLGAGFSCGAGHCRQGAVTANGGEAGEGGKGGAGATSNGGEAGANATSNAGGAGASATSNGGEAGANTTSNSACHSNPDLTPSFPAATELDPNLVARAAAVIGSCMDDDGVARTATHIWLAHLAAPRLYFRLAEQLDCFANAGCGCAALEHCLDWKYSEAPAACTNSCQGSIFTGCGDGAQVTMDCARFGLSCSPTGNCVEEPAAACAGTVTPSCTDQGEVLFCDDGAMRRTPCRVLGFNCVAGKCVGDGASCTDRSSRTDELVEPVGSGCSGNVLQACLGGQATSVDCATQGPGFTCQSRDGSFFCGLAAECVPADNYLSGQAATCEGTTLSYCNAGRLEHLDCTKLGFTGCEIDTTVYHYGCTPGPSGQ